MRNQLGRSIEFGLLWLVSALAVGFLVGSLNIPRLYHLVEQGVQTSGVITELTPQNHNTARYKYSVAGHEFHAQNWSGKPNDPISDMYVGEQVVVYYDSHQPSVSELGDPHPALANEITFVALAVLIFPTAIVATYAARTAGAGQIKSGA